MNPITDIWRQLVRRRLWPVALLLVGALVAVPTLLAKEPEAAPAPASAANAAAGKSALETEPIVALAGPEDGVGDRVPLGDRHDIFKPTKKAPKVTKADDEGSDAEQGGDESPAGSEGSSGKSDTSGGGSAPAASEEPAPSAPAEKKKTYPPGSLLVRFGAGGETVKGYLKKGTPLPSAEEPLIIYLGLSRDGKSAEFMLASNIAARGDGECDPTPESCETVHLREGETEFFDLADETGVITGEGFQLDLVMIVKGKSSDADDATRSSKVASAAKAAGRVRSLGAGIGGEALRRLGVVGRTG